MHQLVKPDTDWLAVHPPSSLVSSPRPEPRLTKLSAYYFAHSIKNEVFILDKLREANFNNNWLRLLLWFLAKDSESELGKTPYYINDYRVMPNTGSDTVEGQFEWFRVNVSLGVAIEVSYELIEKVIDSPIRHNYFESRLLYLIVNSSGKEKLKREYPEIWEEFGLGELSG